MTERQPTDFIQSLYLYFKRLDIPFYACALSKETYKARPTAITILKIRNSSSR